MSQPMQPDGMQTRITGDYFPDRPRGWIFGKNSLDVFTKSQENIGIMFSLSSCWPQPGA
jgi:hypothetical protein